MISQAFILAAGLGTRMGTLTRTTPKPLLLFQGRPMIDYIIDAFQSLGVERIIVNIHAHAAQMRAHLADKNVVLSDEEAELQGNGGAIAFAYQQGLLLDEPCFTHNSDVFFRSPQALAGLAEAWDENKMSALLLLKKKSSGAQGGDFSLDENTIIDGDDFIYTGAQILSPHLFTPPEKEMKSIWQRARALKGFCGTAAVAGAGDGDGDWYHLGTQQAFEQAYPRNKG